MAFLVLFSLWRKQFYSNEWLISNFKRLKYRHFLRLIFKLCERWKHMENVWQLTSILWRWWTFTALWKLWIVVVARSRPKRWQLRIQKEIFGEIDFVSNILIKLFEFSVPFLDNNFSAPRQRLMKHKSIVVEMCFRSFLKCK